MADVSNAIKTIDSHPLEATYFNGKSYDEMVAIDLTEGDLRNVFKTGLYRTCLERDGTTTLKSQCNATGSYSWAADVVVSVQQISDTSAIHIMTDNGYLYFRTVNGTSTDYYWEPYSKLGGGSDVTDYTDSTFLLYDDNRTEDERWADGAYRFTSTTTQTIKVFGLDDGHAVLHDRNNSSNSTTVYFTRIKSGGCRFYYTYLNNTDDKVHIVVGAAYETTSGMASYSDTVLGVAGGSSSDTTYTFASGTTQGAFQVTPSGGSAQSVKIYGLNNAAYKSYTTSISSGNTSLPTSGAVYTYVNNNKPTVGNGTIVITQGGVTKGSFTTNQTGNTTIALDAGGGSGGGSAILYRHTVLVTLPMSMYQASFQFYDNDSGSINDTNIGQRMFALDSDNAATEATESIRYVGINLDDGQEWYLFWNVNEYRLGLSQVGATDTSEPGSVSDYVETIDLGASGGGGSSVESDTVNIKASYSALPSYFNGTCTINPNHLISSDYPIVFFDGVLFSSGSYNMYISKDQIFNAAQGAYILNSTPFGVKKGSVSIATDTSTLNNINIGLTIVTNGLGSVTISLLGRAAKSFTSHAPSGSIGY